MQRRLAWILSLTIIITSMLFAFDDFALAKEKADVKEKAADKEAAPAKAKKKADAKKALRLPPYYADVINEDQREKVASAYTKFNTKIAKLKEEIKAVTAERDLTLEAMLTDEQKATLTKLKEDAKSKRAKTAAK